LPASLLDAAFYLCGDPELHGDRRQFVRNMRELLLRGLDLAPAHHARLLDLYLDRHKPLPRPARPAGGRRCVLSRLAPHPAPAADADAGAGSSFARRRTTPVDDCFGLRLEPSGILVHRLTLRALVRAGLVEDPGVPLFNPAAGQPTAHGDAYAQVLKKKLGE
jgi:hypothetical protein